MLTQEEVLEFKRIYEEEFGSEITYKEAHDRAIEIATLFELLLEPLPGSEGGPTGPPAGDCRRSRPLLN